MAGQQYNPLSFLIMLGLLSFSPMENVNKGLESLSYTLDATAKSLASVKTGIDTMDNGLRQLAQHNTEHASSEPSDFNGTVNQNHNNPASLMPADVPEQEDETANGNTE